MLIPLVLCLFALSGAVVAQDAESPELSASVSVLASSPDGLSAGCDIRAGPTRFLATFLLPADWKPLEGSLEFPSALPEIGFSLAAPGVLVGGARPAYLAFLYRPASAGAILSGSMPAFAQSAPSTARYLVSQVGAGAGAFLARQANDPRALAAGLWVSPGTLPLGAALVFAREPPKPGGPGWLDPPRAGTERLWASMSCALGRAAPYFRMAAAMSLGLPGPDAWAARAEAACRLGAARLSGEASFASLDWRAPDGAVSPGYRLAGDLSWKARAVSAGLAYRASADWDGGPPEGGLRASLALDCAALRGRLAYGVHWSEGQGLSGASLEWSASPGGWTWLGVSGVWRNARSGAERTELTLSAASAGSLRCEAEASVGDDGDGPYLEGRAALSVIRSGYSFRFSCGARDAIRLTGGAGDGELDLSCSQTWFFP